MKKNNLTMAMAISMAISLYGCDSNTSTNANPINSTTNSDTSSNETIGTCDLSSVLPTWSGKNKISWQEAVGGGCTAPVVKASVAEINAYSKALTTASWTNKLGWITSGKITAANFSKTSNGKDSTYQFSASGSSSDSLYVFTLTSNEIAFSSTLEKIYKTKVPEWTATPTPQWIYSSSSWETSVFYPDSADIYSYIKEFKQYGWTGTSAPSGSTIVYTISLAYTDGKTYIYTITNDVVKDTWKFALKAK